MKVYIDLILLLNFILDLLLLISVKLVLKRNTSINKMILSSFFGSLTVLIVFIKINSFLLFLIKLILSFIMILISFGYKDIKYFIKNVIYFYISSIILGGTLYFLELTFSYKQNGMIFINNGLSINFIFLLLSSPIIIYLYIKQTKELKTKYNKFYNLKIIFSDKKVKECIGFYDTGNILKDLYNHPIIIMNYFKCDYKKILVPYKTIEKIDMMECFKIDKLIINKKEYKNILIGLSKEKINIDGVDCILNGLMEDI